MKCPKLLQFCIPSKSLLPFPGGFVRGHRCPDEVGAISWHLPPVELHHFHLPACRAMLGAGPAQSSGRKEGLVLPPCVCNTLSVAAVSLPRCGAGAMVILLHNSFKGTALTLLMSRPHPSIPRAENVKTKGKDLVFGAGRMGRGTWRGRRCCQWKWTAWRLHGEPARIPGGGRSRSRWWLTRNRLKQLVQKQDVALRVGSDPKQTVPSRARAWLGKENPVLIPSSAQGDWSLYAPSPPGTETSKGSDNPGVALGGAGGGRDELLLPWRD